MSWIKVSNKSQHMCHLCDCQWSVCPSTGVRVMVVWAVTGPRSVPAQPRPMATGHPPPLAGSRGQTAAHWAQVAPWHHDQPCLAARPTAPCWDRLLGRNVLAAAADLVNLDHTQTLQTSYKIIPVITSFSDLVVALIRPILSTRPN